MIHLPSGALHARSLCLSLSLSFSLLLTIRGDSVLGRHLRLLLLLRRLLLLLRLLLVVLMMMMAKVADVDGELGMRQLIEVGTRRRRRRRLMAGMHMVVVTRLRILGMRRREVVVMMGTGTLRQQTMHGS